MTATSVQVIQTDLEETAAHPEPLRTQDMLEVAADNASSPQKDEQQVIAEWKCNPALDNNMDCVSTSHSNKSCEDGTSAGNEAKDTTKATMPCESHDHGDSDKKTFQIRKEEVETIDKEPQDGDKEGYLKGEEGEERKTGYLIHTEVPDVRKKQGEVNFTENTDSTQREERSLFVTSPDIYTSLRNETQVGQSITRSSSNISVNVTTQKILINRAVQVDILPNIPGCEEVDVLKFPRIEGREKVINCDIVLQAPSHSRTKVQPSGKTMLPAAKDCTLRYLKPAIPFRWNVKISMKHEKKDRHSYHTPSTGDMRPVQEAIAEDTGDRTETHMAEKLDSQKAHLPGANGTNSFEVEKTLARKTSANKVSTGKKEELKDEGSNYIAIEETPEDNSCQIGVAGMEWACEEQESTGPTPPVKDRIAEGASDLNGRKLVEEQPVHTGRGKEESKVIDTLHIARRQVNLEYEMKVLADSKADISTSQDQRMDTNIPFSCTGEATGDDSDAEHSEKFHDVEQARKTCRHAHREEASSMLAESQIPTDRQLHFSVDRNAESSGGVSNEKIGEVAQKHPDWHVEHNGERHGAREVQHSEWKGKEVDMSLDPVMLVAEAYKESLSLNRPFIPAAEIYMKSTRSTRREQRTQSVGDAKVRLRSHNTVKSNYVKIDDVKESACRQGDKIENDEGKKPWKATGVKPGPNADASGRRIERGTTLGFPSAHAERIVGKCNQATVVSTETDEVSAQREEHKRSQGTGKPNEIRTLQHRMQGNTEMHAAMEGTKGMWDCARQVLKEVEPKMVKEENRLEIGFGRSLIKEQNSLGRQSSELGVHWKKQSDLSSKSECADSNGARKSKPAGKSIRHGNELKTMAQIFKYQYMKAKLEKTSKQKQSTVQCQRIRDRTAVSAAAAKSHRLIGGAPEFDVNSNYDKREHRGEDASLQYTMSNTKNGKYP